MTRIYTRTGDDGTTGLVGGQRVKKHAERIEAYGTIDELSSFLGVARSALRTGAPDAAAWHRLDRWLAWTQDVLFNVGSQLATPRDKRSGAMPHVTADDVRALERGIDEAQKDLTPLTNFIHPGGCAAAAALHVARTVCRRAERLLVALRDTGEEIVSDETIAYANRLSDALFVWARWVNDRSDCAEDLWDKSSAPPPA